jgi:hypothetical protein
MVLTEELGVLLGETIRSTVNGIQYLVGGIFGIYLITLFLKWRQTQMLKRYLADIKAELRHLNNKLGGALPERQTFLERKIGHIKQKLNKK